MPSTVSTSVSNIVMSSNSEGVNQDLWEQAWDTLSAEDRKQYEDCSNGMLDVLKNVCNNFPITPAYIDSVPNDIQV